MSDNAMMTHAKRLMTEAANAILADAPNAAELAEHALGQLKRAQLQASVDEAGLTEIEVMQIRNRAARAAWGYEEPAGLRERPAPKLERVK